MELINDKNEKDIKILTKIFKQELNNNYNKDINLFMKNIIHDFLEKNNFNLIKSEEEENSYLSKLIDLYGNKSEFLLKKFKNFENKLISYKNLKKLFIEENLYSPEDTEKKNIFKFLIYILKKNASYIDELYSINDFLIEDLINFFKGIFDIIQEKFESYEKNNDNDDGLTITDEDFKKIMNTFLYNLNQKMEEKSLNLDELLGEENIKNIKKDGKNIKIMDIYKFVEILKEYEIDLNNSLVISCIFNRYQLNENTEDINIDALESDLIKKEIIL